MAIVISGTAGTITGISAGGLPDGSVTADDLASTLDLGSKTLTIPTDTTGLPSGGIEYYDAWRLSSDQTVAHNDTIDTGWEQEDTTNLGFLGTGMTESSGVFTFPATGIWRVEFFTSVQGGSAQGIHGAYITASADSGSNWYTTAWGEAQTYAQGYRKQINISTTLDVTNASTFQVIFQAYTSAGGSNTVVYQGDTLWTVTGARFMKLGDT